MDLKEINEIGNALLSQNLPPSGVDKWSASETGHSPGCALRVKVLTAMGYNVRCTFNCIRRVCICLPLHVLPFIRINLAINQLCHNLKRRLKICADPELQSKLLQNMI